MLHILHVISGVDARGGGTTTAFNQIASAQARNGLRVTAAATRRPGDEVEPSVREMEAAGAEVRVTEPTDRPLRWVPGLGAWLRPMVESADVVHVHGVWEEIQYRALAEARRAGVPTVITPHGMLGSWAMGQGRLKKSVYLNVRLRRHLARASAIHVAARQEYEDLGPLKLAPALVEPFGVELSEFRSLPARGWLRARCPGIGERPVVLFLSRLHPGKGLELLVPAMARGAARDAALVLAGPEDPAYGRMVRGLVEQHGLADRVFFTGMLRGAERVSAYADADLFVLPSYHENFGIVVAEAMAAGLPAVVTEHVNAKDYVRAAGAGDVVGTMAVEPLVAAIGRWVADAGLRREAGERARRYAMESFDWGTIARRWVGHYERVVAGAGRGRAAVGSR